MGRPPRRDHFIEPRTGPDTTDALDNAIATLAKARGFGTRPDISVKIHLLASLTHEIDAHLEAAVLQARTQNYSWAQIADLLGITRSAAWQRYAHHPDLPS